MRQPVSTRRTSLDRPSDYMPILKGFWGSVTQVTKVFYEHHIRGHGPAHNPEPPKRARGFAAHFRPNSAQLQTRSPPGNVAFALVKRPCLTCSRCRLFRIWSLLGRSCLMCFAFGALKTKEEFNHVFLKQAILEFRRTTNFPLRTQKLKLLRSLQLLVGRH